MACSEALIRILEMSEFALSLSIFPSSLASARVGSISNATRLSVGLRIGHRKILSLIT